MTLRHGQTVGSSTGLKKGFEERWLDVKDEEFVSDVLKQAAKMLNEGLDEVEEMKGKLEALEKKAGRPGQFANGSGGEDSDPQAMKGFGTFLKTGRDPNFDDFQAKSMETGVGADGGYAVPEDFDRVIRTMLPAYSPLVEFIDYGTSSSKSFYEVVDLGGTGAERNAEKSTRNTTSTPKLARIDFKLTEMSATPEVTNEFRHTTQVDGLQGWLMERVAERFGEMMQAEILFGTGTDEAEGIFTKPFSAEADKVRPFGTFQAFTAASATSITADELLTLIYGLAPKFRRKSACRWYMTTKTLAVIAKLKDQDGNYLFSSPKESALGTIAGYPVVEVEDMEDIGAGKTPIMFGDLKQAYCWRELKAYDRMILDEITKKGFTKFYRARLSDGRVRNTNALKFLTMKAAAN